jgi:hypothetical protein
VVEEVYGDELPFIQEPEVKLAWLDPAVDRGRGAVEVEAEEVETGTGEPRSMLSRLSIGRAGAGAGAGTGAAFEPFAAWVWVWAGGRACMAAALLSCCDRLKPGGDGRLPLVASAGRDWILIVGTETGVAGAGTVAVEAGGVAGRDEGALRPMTPTLGDCDFALYSGDSTMSLPLAPCSSREVGDALTSTGEVVMDDMAEAAKVVAGG